MRVIGLTGSIGSGKSTVLSMVKDMHIPCIDSDAISHELMKKGNAGYIEIVRKFGNDILDENGEINRKKMAECIFSNPEKKEMLEAILHPCIQNEIKEFVKCHESEQVVVVEVPLLYEVGWVDYFTEIWSVVCNSDLLFERLEKFRGISKEDALARLKHQISQEEKEEKADVVLYNDSDKEHLRKQIEKALQM